MLHTRPALVQVYRWLDPWVMAGSLAATVRILNRDGEATGTLPNLWFFAALMLGWHVVLTAFRLYQPRSGRGFGSEAKKVVKATSVGSLGVLALMVFLRIEPATSERAFFLLFWGLVTSATLGSRFLLATAAKVLTQTPRQIVVVGINEASGNFVRELLARPDLGYRVLSLVDEKGHPKEVDAAPEGLPVVSIDDLDGFFSKNPVDEVFIAVPMDAFPDHSRRILRLCERRKITVRLLMDSILGVPPESLRVETFSEQPVLTLRDSGGDSLSKR